MWVLFRIVSFPILLLKPISLTFSWCNKRGKDCFNGAKMRLIKPRREFHYLQLFHFTSRKDILKVAFENSMINAKHLRNSPFWFRGCSSQQFLFYNQLCLFISRLVHFYGMGVKLNCYLTITLSILSSPILSSFSSFSLKIGSKWINRVSLCHWCVQKN